METGKNFEMLIYGVQFYFNSQDVEFDNDEKTCLSDEAFISRAEEEGNVWTISGFLRALEEINYGAGNTDFYNMTLRAYLVNMDNPDHVIRMDVKPMQLRVSNVEPVESEVYNVG